jgi:maltooligosyltrehalose synthase
LKNEPFVSAFRRFHRRVAYHGFLNSLAQVVLKVCAPGIPDFYQGTELWDFSLVDPDNRRPVDYPKRESMLRRLGKPSTLLRTWKDGRIKLFVMRLALAARARFQDAPYRAIDTGTPNAFAFMRGDDVLVVIRRLTTREDAWSDHTLDIDGRVKLPTDSSAIVDSEGLLGGNFVSLELGSDDALLKDGDTFRRAQGAISLGSLIAKVVTGGGGSEEKTQ